MLTNKKFLVIFIFIFSTIFIQYVNADPILISKSSEMKDIIFDGKWTTVHEWKHSSHNLINEYSVHIRSAHQDEFLYIMIDVVKDVTFDKNSDRSMICFDSSNNKSKIADDDDYCFIATLGSSNGITLQGGTMLASKDHFKRIENHEDFIAIGNVSDDKDRYTRIPHVSYEFRIPLEVIGRSDNYGFLVYVYDANKNEIITYPESIQIEDIRSIPSPSQWGDMISPDKSLPEFDEKIILFSLALLPILILSRFKKNVFNISLDK